MRETRHYVTLVFLLEFIINLIFVNYILFNNPEVIRDINEFDNSFLVWVLVLVGTVMNIGSTLSLMASMNSVSSPLSSASIFLFLVISLFMLTLFYFIIDSNSLVVGAAKNMAKAGVALNIITSSYFFFLLLFEPKARSFLLGNNNLRFVSSSVESRSDNITSSSFRNRFI